MQMQKILNNVKHQHRDFKPRLNFTSEFEAVALRVTATKNDQTQQLFDQLVGEQKNNLRQKLKIYKKLLQSNEEKDFLQRQFVIEYLTPLHLKEFIFGNTESKPQLMNTFKRLHQLRALTPEILPPLFVDLPLQDYGEARNLLELLDMLQRLQAKPMDEIVAKQLWNAVLSILAAFEEGRNVILGEGFKLKWLEHFVDVLRATNNLVRVFKHHLPEGEPEKIANEVRQIITQHKILTKEVLTQLYLLLLWINPDEKRPAESDQLCYIHYLHACNVVKGISILSPLMQLLPHLKETQHKCQLLPILLKAFQMYYHDYPDKANIFDQAIALFDVGRSIYSYLEEIITIILRDPNAVWNLEGSFLRKFFIATVALKLGRPSASIFAQWPTALRDVIGHAGSMTIPYAHDCALILLTRIFQECNKDYIAWSKHWMPEYERCLLATDNRGQVRGVVEFINPILLSISPEPLLLKEIMNLNNGQQNSGLLIGVISLLKCFKELGKITIDNEKGLFAHSDDSSINLNRKQISELLLHLDSNVALKALEFITVHLKSSQPMEPLELQLALEFYRYAQKTSLPEYRKSYINATKRMFERLRSVYEHELTKTSAQLLKNKRYKPREHFNEFKSFLNQLIALCYENVFPDVIFELANPALQILLMIGQYFGRQKIEIKKGQILEACHILTETSYFEKINFENLLCCLQSSYQSVRLLAHQILRLFHDLSDGKQLLQLWQESLINANRLTIKSYEYACRILAFISQSYPNLLKLPARFKLQELNICQLFLEIVRERYAIFRTQFATQQEDYYKNLIHGMLTVFSYSFDYLANQIRNDPQIYIPYFNEIREFLTDFFQLINQIILFSVQICSSNISTVVLDSLPQSQTDKKYKVDCRGHFLEECKGSVGQFLQSPALLTSMENEDEGIQNTLVVSFYLLTREAGLVFQSIGNLVGTSHSSSYIPNQGLVQVVNTYFYALINLKHMGSVDRISGGLARMSKVIFDNEDKQLSQLPEKLLDKLLVNLAQGNFTNILRRSAGVPYAFTCLLKSQALRRKQMIERTIVSLLQLSRQQVTPTIELRIHSLNILKKLFQDGDLKSDLDPYVSAAFMSSIKGFTSQEWGVRNSSLMLFSVLANRTLGTKPTYNLLEFFHRCPELLSFFKEQLQSTNLDTMYPPLYPIVLLLSRLLPFDLKERPKMANKGELNLKQIRKESLLLLLPLIERAGLNNNYMGRVMAAKAILPFMEINRIIPYCLNLLQQCPKITSHNLLHYKLTACFQLFLSLRQIINDKKYNLKLSQEIAEQLTSTIAVALSLIDSKSSVVSEVAIKIIHHLFENYRQYFEKANTYVQLLTKLANKTKVIIDKYFGYPLLIVPFNMGDSMAIKEALNLHLDILCKYQLSEDSRALLQNYSGFLHFLSNQGKKNSRFLLEADTEIIEYYLEKIVQFLTDHPQSELEGDIRTVLDTLDIQQVSSSNVLIKLLNLRALLKVPLSLELTNFLSKEENQTNNHFLKIAIFKYIQALDIKHPLILPLLFKFSRPQELEELRECVVEYLEQYPHSEQQFYIVYIRLLEDEQCEIRLETARVLATKLGLPQLNEQVVKNYLLERLSVEGFEQLLSDASDFEVKRRNNGQQRIFSYDKPNKYRSDISNIIFALTHNIIIRQKAAQLAQVVQRQFVKHELEWNNEVQFADKYQIDIINRNQYQFEIIIRLFLLSKEQLTSKLSIIFKSHPLLKKIHQIYIKE